MKSQSRRSDDSFGYEIKVPQIEDEVTQLQVNQKIRKKWAYLFAASIFLIFAFTLALSYASQTHEQKLEVQKRQIISSDQMKSKDELQKNIFPEEGVIQKQKVVLVSRDQLNKSSEGQENVLHIKQNSIEKEQDIEDTKGLIRQIVHIWIGEKIPELYLKRLASCSIKINLLTTEDWKVYGQEWLNYTTLLDIQKSDILRLLYLYQNGGIYHDFDVTCDYEKLFEGLPKQKGCYIGSYKSGYKSNSFLYCNEKENKEFKRLIEEVRQRIEKQERGELGGLNPDDLVMKTTGPTLIQTLSYLKPLPLYHKVCDHENRATWLQTDKFHPKGKK